MNETFLIEVAPKPAVKDPAASGIAEAVRQLRGSGGVRKVAVSKLYRLAGDLTPEERQRVGEELLCDPVIEEYHEEGSEDLHRNSPAALSKGTVIDVWYKPGVTDAVGESVLKGTRDMGLENVQNVRTGTRYRFWGLKNRAAAEKLALAVLINPLIHDRIIHAD